METLNLSSLRCNVAMMTAGGWTGEKPKSFINRAGEFYSGTAWRNFATFAIKLTEKEKTEMLGAINQFFTGRHADAFIERVEQDAKEADLAERKRRAAEKAEAEKTLDKEQPPLLRAIESGANELEVMRKRHAEEEKQVERRLEPVRRDLANFVTRCQRIIDRADAYLMVTASPKIYEFQKELESRRNSLLPETQSGRSVEGRDIITRSNHESVNAAVDRINQIICRDLKALMLQPLSESELESAIEDLRQSVPIITMKKVR
jgi:hypothetical protein